jgi:ribosomal protein S27E
MARVISRGSLPTERFYVLTCKNCQSLIEFQAREGKQEHDRDGSFIRFTCPVCLLELFGYGEGKTKSTAPTKKPMT